MDSKKQKIKKVWQGIVVSDKMDKTIVVRVDRVISHPKYKKKIVRSKKYKVHDPENKYKVGQNVKFVETRPISKDKKWIVLESK